MFQKSLLKIFVKSCNAPDESKIIKLVTKEAIEKLGAEVDRLVYGLSGDEVGIVEGDKNDK